MEPDAEPQSMPSPTHAKLPELPTCLKQEGYVAELTFGRGEKWNHTALQIFKTNWARTPQNCTIILRTGRNNLAFCVRALSRRIYQAGYFSK
jgi:hypothetical protein